MTHRRSWTISAGMALALLASPLVAQRGPGPLTPDQLDKLVPKHPGYLGALAPENLRKKRPAPGFDLTGTWFVDLSEGFNKFMFGPPYPDFLPDAAKALAEGQAAAKAGRTYRDAIGQCYPPGMPMIMTRVWPIAMIQLPTVIYMVAGFENSFRAIYLDGRAFSDPDTVVHSYNGESIGHWEGKTLVVETRYIEPDNHYIDSGIPVSDDFAMTERMTMLDGGRTLQIEYIMTDPQNWKGEWRNTKRWTRQDHTDIGEVECILANNAHLPGTDLGNSKVGDAGDTEPRP
ncbi:hypothetical protein [Sphingobium nicotianae]|uniref:DUF1329 domain-containing protein n=1 Tax=Sphingobium nicotianae TaxID=2782607 RepID=A0A9X1D9P9_9SPHN|nr:hypothetical protein [Sphingobium nicotianae]MBT2185959.1 hypothetical protein [Sphingobium nicotianae]